MRTMIEHLFKITLFCYIFLFFSSNSFAQDSLLLFNQQKPVLKAVIITPGLAYEVPIGLRTSVYMQAGIGIGYQNLSRPYLVTTGILIVQPRFYYNYRKRLAAGKNTAGFASNYIGFRGMANGSFLKETLASGETLALFGLHLAWGMQRNIGKRGFFYVEAGPHANFSEKSSFRVFPIGFFGGLGIKLGKL